MNYVTINSDSADLKMWNASRFCVSSLRRGHANLLCIVPILVYVLPKQVHSVKAWKTNIFCFISDKNCFDGGIGSLQIPDIIQGHPFSKIILHRIISVVWLTNFLPEIRRLTKPRRWGEGTWPEREAVLGKVIVPRTSMIAYDWFDLVINGQVPIWEV